MCQSSARKYKNGFLFRFWNEQALFIPVQYSPSVAQCPSDQCPVLCFLPRPGDPCLGGLASSPARTGHGPGRSLLSPLLTSQHTHHHTPKDTKKTQKCVPMTSGREKVLQSIRGSWGIIFARVWGARSCEEASPSSQHSDLRCPEPGPRLANVRTHSWGSHRPAPRYSAQAVPAPALMSRMSQGQSLITLVTLVTTPALHPPLMSTH